MASHKKIELRRRLPLVWLGLLLIPAVLLPNKVWTALLVGIGGMFVAAYLWVWILSKGLWGQRRLRFGWVSVGDRLSEEYELHNTSALPALWVEVIDHSNVPGYQGSVVRSLGASTVDRWRQSAICQQRGQFHLGPWSLRSGDPLGIFELTIDYPISDEIIIHPPIHTQLPVPLPAGQSSGRVRVRKPSWQATVNASSVRDYQENDPYRWIHWPTSARRDQLFVRQFDLDTAGDIWLLLDLQAEIQLGQGAESTEEQAVILAAAMAAQGLGQNRAVGLAAYGREPHLIPPARGVGQQWNLLKALALVNADGENDLSLALRDLSQIARRGSAAVIITPSAEVNWLPDLLPLSSKGVQGHIILLDRPSFAAADDLSGEDDTQARSQSASQGLLSAIRSHGFNGTIIRKGEVGRPSEEQVRRGYWEFKVTATGKVITVRSPLEP